MLGSAQSEVDETYLVKKECVRTDFKDGQSYQKVVQFNYDGTLMVTGGSDCVLRVWKVHCYNSEYAKKN